MEFFWYVTAALGAGIGTGLAGLSAATVMVPILIVLCPSFAGETGAYQATAIALASDILGVQKTPGEIRKSLLMLFLMFASVITVTWGLFDEPHIAAAAILMWGTGE